MSFSNPESSFTTRKFYTVIGGVAGLTGNLLIFEYLYNLNGVTLFVFSNAFDYSGYQYSFVVNGLFTLLALYTIVYALLGSIVFGWEKVIVR